MFKVKEIVSGNEIILTSNWFHQGYEGNRVWVDGFVAPKKGEAGYDFAKNKLRQLINEEGIFLYNPRFWSAFGNEIIVCDVYTEKMPSFFPISTMFPEFGGRI